MKWVENRNYELIPADTGGQSWNIRILDGPFVETVLEYGAVALDGRGKNTCLKFSFDVVWSPNDEIREENVELQQVAADILEMVIENGFESGSVQTKEIDEG